MNSALHLPHFVVRGFRCFEDLRIDGLGRVNLIVGKNGVGKTALLESIETYAATGYPVTLLRQLSHREEASVSTESLFVLPLADLGKLFHGRKSIEDAGATIQVGTDAQIVTIKTARISGEGHPMATPAIVVSRDNLEQTYWFDVQYSARIPNRFFDKQLNHTFVTSDMTRSSGLADMWESVALTPREDDVLTALQLLNPDIQQIAFLNRNGSNGKKRGAHVRLGGSDVPVPLGSLGEGMSRVLALVVALVNAQGGILLVDEIENGIHYSTQEKLWRFLFETAERLETQVFATTHSWDCLQAFQVAGTQHDGKVLRLQAKKGRIVPSLIEEADLAVVTREHIEIR